MRRVILGQPIGQNDFPRWVMEALREIERASFEDAIEVADAYTFVLPDPFTETRELDVETPSTANIAAVLATFIQDLQRRGTTRIRDT
jgi:hypothetical protein